LRPCVKVVGIVMDRKVWVVMNSYQRELKVWFLTAGNWLKCFINSWVGSNPGLVIWGAVV